MADKGIDIHVKIGPHSTMGEESQRAHANDTQYEVVTAYVNERITFQPQLAWTSWGGRGEVTQNCGTRQLLRSRD